MSHGQIAQLIIPSDGLGTQPSYAVPDWDRGRLFLFNNGGALRRYSIALVTQSPSVSVDSSSWGSWVGIAGDVDPVTGNLIAVWVQGNASTMRKIDPVTLTLLDSFGAAGAFPNWPTSFWFPQQIICVQCGSVGYAFFKESEFSGTVGVVRVSDQFTQAGFYTQVVSGSTDNRGFFCRGASGLAGGSIFGSWNADTTPTPTIPLYGVFITPGAESYDPATWPATNPHITSRTIGTIAAASVDATWSNLQCARVGYDQTDGNVLMQVSTTDSVATKNYLIKVNATTAAVMWRLPILGTGQFTDIHLSQILSNTTLFLNTDTTAWTVNTATGTATSLTVGGLTTVVDTVFSDYTGATSNIYVWRGDYNQAASLDSPAPVSGTPTSFSGLALIQFAPAVAKASLADLWFAPTPDFVDLGVRSNRRLFISQEGAPISLGATGAAPTGNQPPAFFSRAQGNTADSFAINLGSGGSFTLVAGDLTDAATAPPCSLQVSTTTTPPSKGVGVVGDYRNGKLHAFNMDTLLDNTSQRRWVRSWRGATEATREPVRYNSVRVDMETGAGVPVAANPQIVLRYSDDGGHNWSNPRIMSVGARGQTGWNVKATRLGATGRHSQSDRIFEISSTDEFKVAIVGAVIEAG